ncbi:hypothetical protein ZYGR_0W00250 [Zygosaccharomyces rouxii]|uniref:ZYRO0F16764p n=2 Tax=Zygosaccharomyces rouxii TaxID=4956 RepID=C5DYY6_ZYGRC|nr:uncharacterized protein ZYRO0F16764g [Zygosaccharomyces rouxii]KAH9201291.1 peptidase S8/S53 domain-containing protein [Zygosaccharomyces rouxii]GAV50499.1 hypothetical protein ZYGR_0W00250 [Zygosaccharomyces rouxii]CAQ43377.1 Uncharacterised protein Kpol_2000p68 [Zygosaccharomyces rouxii]CAR28997.1 ZYRO0F16764p [Zygosaccharomyces rouxii]
MLWFLTAILSTALAAQFVVQLQDKTALNAVLNSYALSSDQQGPEITDIFELGSFRAFTGDFSGPILQKLYNDPNVLAISRDGSLKLQEIVLQNNAPSHLVGLSSISPLSHQPFIYRSNGGNGVDVYLLDTGIDIKHPNLSKLNILRMADLTQSPVPQGTDPQGHGTAMAGIIASETFGVLKKCNLVDVRVADSNGDVKLSTILQALTLTQRHIEGTKRPSVVVIPLEVEDGNNPILTEAIASFDQSVPIIIPAGNNAQDALNFSPANVNPKPKNIIVVGSVDVNNNPTKFTNYGSNVDVFTVGEQITTLQSTDLDSQGLSNSLTRQVSGTSASSAITAGVIGYYMSLGLNSTQSINKVLQYSRCANTFAKHSTNTNECARLLQLQP